MKSLKKASLTLLIVFYHRNYKRAGINLYFIHYISCEINIRDWLISEFFFVYFSQLILSHNNIQNW